MCPQMVTIFWHSIMHANCLGVSDPELHDVPYQLLLPGAGELPELGGAAGVVLPGQYPDCWR